MAIILGIDSGGSTTKIVGYHETGELVSVLQVKATDQITSVYGAFGKFISENRLSLGEIKKIILTGVGASLIDGRLYDIPTARVDEFVAIGLGGLRLSGKREGLVVSMGTGTAFVRAGRNGISHIGGSGVGGGTLVGLGGRLIGANHFETIIETALEGDLSHVDLTIEDICADSIATLPPHTTASNFGKMQDSANNADVSIGIINMVFQTIGMMAVFACRGDDVRDVVLTGNLTTIPQAKEIFERLQSMYDINFIIPENSIYATAMGAALSELYGRRID